MRRALLVVAVLAAAAVIGAVVWFGAPHPDTTNVPSASPRASSMPSPIPTPTATFNPALYSTTDPSSLWVVVDKRRPLNPANYVPPDLVSVPVPYANPPRLRKQASDAVVAMFAAFTTQTGLTMISQSAYRSYQQQVSVHDSLVRQEGQVAADQASARPGFSEHQTGLAIDIAASPAACSLAACFATTPQGEWLASNAWRYGFVLRYPAGQTSVTGYEYEPWHYRFVGVELSTEYHARGAQTLEGFFGLPGAPDYGP